MVASQPGVTGPGPPPLLVKPHPLPRMDFSRGIPAPCRTRWWCPPCSAAKGTWKPARSPLEVRFLANRDPAFFGLPHRLPRDAADETLPTDARWWPRARAGIDALNATYATPDGDVFFLFHRPRRWNPQDRPGWAPSASARKLADLNALRGYLATPSALVAGDTTILGGVVRHHPRHRQRPAGCGAAVRPAMAHPLNQPVLRAGRASGGGYGILQPRWHQSADESVSPALRATPTPARRASTPIHAGVRMFIRTCSAKAPFIGKGIYDVDAFEAGAGARFRRTASSATTFEGCYARRVAERPAVRGLPGPLRSGRDPPPPLDPRRLAARRLAAAPRAVPVRRRRRPHRQPNPCRPCPGGSSWTTSGAALVPPALLAPLLVLGWATLDRRLWTGLLGRWSGSSPALCAVLLDLLKKRATGAAQHLAAVAHGAGQAPPRSASEFACLLRGFSLDAIGRTLWRPGVTSPAPAGMVPSARSSGKPARPTTSWRLPDHGHRPSPWWRASLLALSPRRWGAGGGAGPCCGVAIIAIGIGSTHCPRAVNLSIDQTLFSCARGLADLGLLRHLLSGPPTIGCRPTTQEYRVASVAHRTSPTNIRGMALLATWPAYDFGYSTGPDAGTANTHRALDTLARLTRYRGTSTTGTTPAASNLPLVHRRWIAATSPATRSPCSGRAWRTAGRPDVVPATCSTGWPTATSSPPILSDADEAARLLLAGRKLHRPGGQPGGGDRCPVQGWRLLCQRAGADRRIAAWPGGPPVTEAGLGRSAAARCRKPRPSRPINWPPGWRSSPAALRAAACRPSTRRPWAFPSCASWRDWTARRCPVAPAALFDDATTPAARLVADRCMAGRRRRHPRPGTPGEHRHRLAIRLAALALHVDYDFLY